MEISLKGLKEITKRFSAEDAIRYFLNAFPDKTLTFLIDCARDENYHVRRLATEGTRPKLPWAQKLTIDYHLALPILEILHGDKTRYVTRSVANHLNDISKIDPDLVLDTLRKWQEGDRRYLNLDEWGMPALVGEISDTTIIHDLDEKKHLYAALGISEYWVIDVQAQRVFVFILDSEKGKYVASETSSILTGLKAELLVAALNRLENEGNTQVAQWFAQQLQTQTEKSGE